MQPVERVINVDIYLYLVALSYFNNKSEHYILSELSEISGLTLGDLNDLLIQLIEKEYLKYINFMLGITDEGIAFLAENHYHSHNGDDEQFVSLNVNSKNILPLTSPYIPDNFLKKHQFRK